MPWYAVFICTGLTRNFGATTVFVPSVHLCVPVCVGVHVHVRVLAVVPRVEVLLWVQHGRQCAPGYWWLIPQHSTLSKPST